MGDNIHLGDRNGVRTPMQWNGGWNAGFSSGDPGKSVLPSDSQPGVWLSGGQCDCAESESNIPCSTGCDASCRCAIPRRVFGRGSIEFLYPANHRVLAYVRQLGKETVLVVNNLSGTAQAVELDLRRYKGNILIEMFGQNMFPTGWRNAISADAGTLSVLLVSAAANLANQSIAGFA